MTRLALLPPSLAVSPPRPLKLLSVKELWQELDFWIRQTRTGNNAATRSLAHDYVRLCEEHIAAFAMPKQLLKLVHKVDTANGNVRNARRRYPVMVNVKQE